MKTIRDWFETIADSDIRKRAIKNTSKHVLNIEKPSLGIALSSAFAWTETPEGYAYWIDIYLTTQK